MPSFTLAWHSRKKPRRSSAMESPISAQVAARDGVRVTRRAIAAATVRRMRLARSLAAHLGGRIEHGADDLVVAGAAAEIAGEPVARLGLGRAGIAVEQRLGGDQQARRAEAALQRRMLEEFALQRMQAVAVRHALDGLDAMAFGLDRQHQAGAD